MKRLNVFIALIIIFFIIGCYMIPTKIPSIPNWTLSIPFGDTTVTVLQAAELDTKNIQIVGDTVYARTKVRSRIDIPSIPAGSLRLSLYIEELLPEDIIDLDSTNFGSTVDKIINYVYGRGIFNDTAGGRIRHIITSRNDDTIRNITIPITIPTGVYDSINPFCFELNLDSFPAGDYRHDIDFVIDSADYTMTLLESYSKAALFFHLKGDRCVIYMRDQGLISPPDSTPLDLINSIDLTLNIRNRIPLGGRLIFALYNKPGERVLLDTFAIELPPVDNTGRTSGPEGVFNFTLTLDTTLYEVFAYDSIHYKARVEIPVTVTESGDTVERAFVRPIDYMTLGGHIIINLNLDNNNLSEENKIF